MDGEAVQALYGLPLEDFIAARDTLAKQLRDAGDKDAAKRVKALRKPSVAAWTLNQLPRRFPDDTQALLDASERLRRAQRKALSGGSAQDLRDATGERRRAAADLAQRAEEVLQDAGHAVSASTMKAVHDSLTAIAADEEGAEAFAKGVLERDLKPGAVVDVGGLKILEGGKGAPAPKPTAPTSPGKEVSSARKTLALAKAALADLEAKATAAEAEAAELRRAATEADEASSVLARDAEAAHAEADGLARRAAEARERAEALSEDAAAALDRAEVARREAAAAEDETRRRRSEAEEAARTVAEAEDALGP